MESKSSAQTAWVTVFAAATFVAPIVLLASTLAYSIGGGFNNDQTGGVIQLYAMAAFMPVLAGLTRLIEPWSPRTAAVLILTGALGIAGGIAYAVDSIHLAATGVTAEELGIAGPLALMLPGIFFPLTLLGAGIALARSGVAPRGPALLLCLAAVLFPVSRIGSIEPLGIAVDVLFVAALWPFGWSLLRGQATVGAPQVEAARPGNA